MNTDKKVAELLVPAGRKGIDEKSKVIAIMMVYNKHRNKYDWAGAKAKSKKESKRNPKRMMRDSPARKG